MGSLVTDPNLADADRAYRMLTEAQRGLSDAEANALVTRLLLLLVNHVGDLDVLAEAIAAAKAAGGPPAESALHNRPRSL